jgi:hypothetical protein
LRPAPGETGARDAVPLFGSHQSNWVLHTSNSSKFLLGHCAGMVLKAPVPLNFRPSTLI